MKTGTNPIWYHFQKLGLNNSVFDVTPTKSVVPSALIVLLSADVFPSVPQKHGKSDWKGQDDITYSSCSQSSLNCGA